MSVLMTAAAKKGGLRPKSAKPTKKKKKTTSDVVTGGLLAGIFCGTGMAVVPPAPPMSDEHQSVWYWELEGEPMTVIFDKHTCQVWCNGVKAETLEGFSDEYNLTGPILHFGIFAKKTSSVHQGSIHRGFSSSSNYMPASSPSIDQLFVNDCQIMEHAYRPFHSDAISATGLDLCCARLPPYAFDELPSYEEAIMQPLAHLQLEESKKKK